MKTVESRIAPNPMEAKIWIDLSEDPHGLVKKYWNGEKWIVKGGNGVSKEDVLKTLEPMFKELKNESSSNYERLLNIINGLTKRVAKLEQYIVTE